MSADNQGIVTVYTCVHGGQWAISGTSGDVVVSPSDRIVDSGCSLSQTTPCPGIPNAGIPPCVPGSIIASGSKKEIGGNTTVTSMDVQISTSNGLPFIPIKFTPKVLI